MILPGFGRKMGAALKSFLNPLKIGAKYSRSGQAARGDIARRDDMSDDSSNVGNNGEKDASKAERHEARLKRQAARAAKSGGGDGERPARICTLSTVEVKKDHEGYHVAVSSGGGRRAFVIAPQEIGPVLKDLETAIQVIRGQQ
jgi:hypothetical protein